MAGIGSEQPQSAGRFPTQSLPFSLTRTFPKPAFRSSCSSGNRGDHIVQNVTIPAGNWGLIMATSSDPRVIGLTFAASQ